MSDVNTGITECEMILNTIGIYYFGQLISSSSCGLLHVRTYSMSVDTYVCTPVLGVFCVKCPLAHAMYICTVNSH